MEGDLATQISDFLQAAQSASIDLGCLVEKAQEMGLSMATAVAIAQADPQKVADFVAVLSGFLGEITADSDGVVIADGLDIAELLGHLGPPASPAIPALEYCLGLDGAEYDLIRWLQLMAAEAVSKITGDFTTALAVATELLADPEWWLVGHAADTLADLGPAAKPALADLERLLGQ
jgi:hypothetical protein